MLSGETVTVDTFLEIFLILRAILHLLLCANGLLPKHLLSFTPVRTKSRILDFSTITIATIIGPRTGPLPASSIPIRKRLLEVK